MNKVSDKLFSSSQMEESACPLESDLSVGVLAKIRSLKIVL